MAESEEQKTLIKKVKNSMITTEKLDKLITRLDEKDTKISHLKGGIEMLEKINELFERKLDVLEFYCRRKNLRVIGIPLLPLGTKSK